MIELLSALITFFASRWNVIAIGTAAVTTIYAYVMGVIEQVSSLITQLDSVTAPAFADVGLNLSPFSLMNYILPLDLAVTLFTAWLVFWLACVAVRIVKAWIPTMS